MRRGDVYYADLEPSVGSEANKRRPCLIVSNDANNRAASTLTVLPITSKVARVYPFEVRLDSELDRPCKVQPNQVRTISKTRLVGAPLVRLSTGVMQRVGDALRLHLDL
ncbi:MAG: type II toxin-antitoxin system PemK/MazF family toxin [Trueperaceae bacterium]|nr:type II toxin-antitoxin system PemK/MazF family toxin [Trueperaceae bacterium]